jgi:hypothetical protein
VTITTKCLDLMEADVRTPKRGSASLGLRFAFFVLSDHLPEKLQILGAYLGDGALGPGYVENVLRHMNSGRGIAADEKPWRSHDGENTRAVGIRAADADLDFLCSHDAARSASVDFSISVLTHEIVDDALVFWRQVTFPSFFPGLDIPIALPVLLDVESIT